MGIVIPLVIAGLALATAAGIFGTGWFMSRGSVPAENQQINPSPPPSNLNIIPEPIRALIPQQNTSGWILPLIMGVGVIFLLK